MTPAKVNGPRSEVICRDKQLHIFVDLLHDVEGSQTSPTMGLEHLDTRSESTVSRQVITRDPMDDGEMAFSDHKIARRMMERWSSAITRSQGGVGQGLKIHCDLHPAWASLSRSIATISRDQWLEHHGPQVNIDLSDGHVTNIESRRVGGQLHSERACERQPFFGSSNTLYTQCQLFISGGDRARTLQQQR